MHASFAQTRGPALSVFPYFLDATATKRHTDTEPNLTDEESRVVPPTPVKQSITLCLPILSVSVDVTVDGRLSYTKLTQSFLNPSEQAIPEARHTFPLYDGAVVTSFECEIGDVRRLQGVVKPKAQAKHEFEKARANKREAAALLEELTPEIFETSLGNIPAKTKVDITLTYVHELQAVTSREEKAEGLAITIPTSLAPHYGDSMVSIPPSEIPTDRLEINIKVLDNGTINPAACHIESDHHATYEGYQPVRNVVIASISQLHLTDSKVSNESLMQHAWRYLSKSKPSLKRDLILVITMHEETRLRSRAVIASPNEDGHAALMVSLRPNDIFGSAVRPESFSGEILFILDRSASMGWPVSGEREFKINTMKRAMLLALAGLPATCVFNIISFGSEVRGMWAESHQCNEDSLSYAKEYVSTVKDDMLGTRVLLALKGALGNRTRTCSSTQIILVTDGEVDDEPHEAILDFVLKSRRELGDQVRFFTLGIGDNSAHGILESIAELGGGYCDVVDVVKSQRWESRFNRMLRSVMEPDRWSCNISLGPEFEQRSLADHDFGAVDRPITTPAVYVQGPHPIPALHPFRYKSVFFLLDLKTTAMPKTVTVTTTTETAKTKDYTISVEPAQFREGTLHHLAANAILLNLKDEVKGSSTDPEQARINGEMLGMKYNISSQWTSFVAVTNQSEAQTHQIDLYKSHFVGTDLQSLSALETDGTTVDSSESESDSDGDSDSELLGWGSRPINTAHERIDWSESSPSYGYDPGVRGYDEPPKNSFRDSQVSRNMAYNYDRDLASRPFSRDTGSKSPQSLSSQKSSQNPTTGEVTTAQAKDDQNWTDNTQYTGVGRVYESSTPAYNVPVEPRFGSLKNRHAASEQHDTTSHDPSDGCISWEDALGCVKGGLFNLSDSMHSQLYCHFCEQTVERLRETLRDLPSLSRCDEEDLIILIDTLMMIQYFKTHQTNQEEFWGLMVGKAERTVQHSMEYKKHHEAALKPLYEMLLSSMSHAHLLEALKHGSVERGDTEKSMESASLKTCLICRPRRHRHPLIGAYGGGLPFTSKVFVCPSDACYNTQTSSRTRYTSWASFWKHQVESSHMLCPKVKKDSQAGTSRAGYSSGDRRRKVWMTS